MPRIMVQPGPQTVFSSTPADIALFGGSAGGGKTFSLAYEAARYVHVRNYAGVIFRRTSPELVGGGSIWEEASKLYPHIGGKDRKSPVLEFTFERSNARIEFRHLQHEHSVFAHQSKQYDFCVARGTLVLMADGSSRPIEQVRIGDMVATLEGPRPVTRTHCFGVKPVAQVVTPYGVARVSMTHRLLLSFGWVAPEALMSMQSHADCRAGEASALQCQAAGMPRACRRLGPQPARAHVRRALDRTHRQDSFALRADDQNGCRASARAPRAAPRPPLWFGRAVLYGPSHRSDLHGCTSALSSAHACAHCDSLAPDCSGDCLFLRRFCGARSRQAQAIDRASSPSPADAAAPSSCARSRTDDRGVVHGHNHGAKRSYIHPYTMAARPRVADVHLGPIYMAPAGEAELFDLTVAEAAHYVLASPRLVASNCGFDELTHFTALQFWYMLSRLRSGSAAPKRMRGTCNPDPDSFVRQLIDWWIGEDGIAIAARSGVIRWFTRLNEKLIWGDSPDEVTAYDSLRIRRWRSPREDGDDRPEPMSFTFIRARATDNKVLLKQDPTYLARLNLLGGAQAKRLRDGNWNARDVAGDFFDRLWCPVVDRIDEANVRRRVRFWDKAATSPSAKNPDPDWTRGARIAELDTGVYVLEDLQSLRAGPADVDRLMLGTAHADGIRTEIGCWIDPGQAGKVDETHMLDLLRGFSFTGFPARQNKSVYARVWTPHAKARRLALLQREYLLELYAELEGYPTAAHDDIMDGISGCFQMLFGGITDFAYDAVPDDRHGPPPSAWDDQDDDDDDPKGRGLGRGACF